MSTWILYLILASVILSFFIAGFVYERYLLTGKKLRHLQTWFIAWVIVGIRTGLELFNFTSPSYTLFVAYMTLAHSIMWYYGLAQLMKYQHLWKRSFTLVYIAACALSQVPLLAWGKTHLAIASIYLIFTPIMYFILAYAFFKPALHRKKLGLSLVSGAFFLWGLDYLIFGYPYYVLQNHLAGTIGWFLGFLFRILIIMGFYLMVEETSSTY